MNKKELLAKIGEKITPNGVGEITAEVLAEILVEIVNNNTLILDGQVTDNDGEISLSNEQQEQIAMFFVGKRYIDHEMAMENWESIAESKIIIEVNFGDEFAYRGVYHVEGEIGNDGESITIALVCGTRRILVTDV